MHNGDETFEPIWAAGFRSGTSMDAVDAALILTDGERVLDFGATAERAYTPQERAVLQRAAEAAGAWAGQGEAPEAAFAAAREVITASHTETWTQLLASWAGPVPALAAVPGPAVRLRGASDPRRGATVQLVDPQTLQAALGVRLAHESDFADLAAGGQGGSLALTYHGALMDWLGSGRPALLDLGDVARITVRGEDGRLLGFDAGPATGPIDEWVEGHGRSAHDEGGRVARAGLIHEGLLAQLFEHPFFVERPPKWLDRFDFNASLARGLTFEDGAATLTAFAARAVGFGLSQIGVAPDRVIALGGGRHNPVLMERLAEALPCPIMGAEAAALRGDSIEAEAFAFLAVRARRGLPIS